MEKTFETKYGEVILRNAMIDVDGTTLVDRAMEYFGGTIGGVEPNKAYSDGLRE
jgi:hypothetical protein